MSHKGPIRVAALGLVLAACTTITEELPERQSPVGPVVVVPVPAPLPVPAPTAVPVPVPAPVPAPASTPEPGPGAPPPPPSRSGSCTLPPGNGSGNHCPRQNPSFLASVESAIDQLARLEPNVFDKSRTRGCGTCYRVVNVNRYVSRMPALMGEQGLCAVYDGEELAVKNSNSFNDQYDILTSDNFIRRDTGSYRATCRPAWF
jgi:hypothetical protein